MLKRWTSISSELRPAILSAFFATSFLPMHSNAGSQDNTVSYPVEDHLVTVNLNADKKFRLAMEKKLFVPAVTAARIVEEPAGLEGEAAVSVYSINDPNAQTFRVTFTKAERNMWGVMSELSGGHTSEEVNVRRCDANIPASAALAVHRAWNEMLSRVRDYDVEVRAPTHATIVEYSRVESGARPLYGEVPFEPGKSVLALERIGRLLFSYCQANRSRQNKIAKQIQSESNRLVAELEKQKKATENKSVHPTASDKSRAK